MQKLTVQYDYFEDFVAEYSIVSEPSLEWRYKISNLNFLGLDVAEFLVLKVLNATILSQNSILLAFKPS